MTARLLGTFIASVFLVATPSMVAADETGKPRSANQLLHAGEYEVAAAEFRKSLSDKSNVEDAIGLGECLFETGRYDEATAILDSVRHAEASSATWNLLAAKVAGARGDYENAIEYARRAKDIDRNSCVARLLIAQYLETIGQPDKALREYEWFDRLVRHRLPIDAANLTAAGTGFYRYSVLTQHENLVGRTRHVLQKIYQKAYQILDPNYWPARLAVADLLREKFSYEEAASDYRIVLDMNTNAVRAHVGLGWIALDQWRFEYVDLHASEALDVNTNSVEALGLLATSRLMERRYQDAERLAKQILTINPNCVEGLALQASARFAQYDDAGAGKLIAKAKRINDKSAAPHQIIARSLSTRRQYPLSEKHFLKAVELEPSNAVVRADLGLMYMQWGDEAKARGPLEKAWKLDPFDARTKYTLDLLDDLDAFPRILTDHFDVRCDSGLDEVIAQQAADYLESIYDEICERFEIQLERRTIVEIFPTHSAFGVRVTAKPWIHTVGACTGWVIAVDIPRTGSDAHGPFDLPGVLRHEFVHTVTLAATNNRIPHWMTEGLAVYHEDLPRSYEWSRGLARRLRHDELFTLETIDWGFARPRRQDDRAMAYAQGEWMCEFLYERFGDGIINVMLRDFRDGKTQAEIFRKHTKMSKAEFDAAFLVWARKDAATWGFDLDKPDDPMETKKLVEARPKDAGVIARHALALLEDDRIDEASAAAESSLKLDANSNALAHEVIMRTLSGELQTIRDAAKAKQHEDKILEHARTVLTLDPQNRRARTVLAYHHLGRKDVEAALPHLLDLADLPPVDPHVHLELAKIFDALGDDAKALPHWKACLIDFEHDPQIPAAMATIHIRAGRTTEAKEWFEQALRIAPFSTAIGNDYAEMLMRMGKTNDAIEQYRLLCRVKPDDAKFHTACALALLKSGHHDEAKQFAIRAVALDPKSAARTLID